MYEAASHGAAITSPEAGFAGREAEQAISGSQRRGAGTWGTMGFPHDHAPWQRLYFLPEPHQQGSFRPILPVAAPVPTASRAPPGP